MQEQAACAVIQTAAHVSTRAERKVTAFWRMGWQGHRPVICHVLLFMIIQLFEVFIQVVGLPCDHLLQLRSAQQASFMLATPI